MTAEAKKNKGTELARKITISTVTGGAKEWFEKLMALPVDNRQMNLMAVYGFANGYKADSSEFGEFVKINGTFRAVNQQTGEITNSPQLILPTYIGHAMAAALDSPDRAGPLKFAFEVDVKFDASAIAKYVYVVRDIMPAQQDDPLSALGAALAYEKPLTLEAPKTPEQAPADADVKPAATSKGKK